MNKYSILALLFLIIFSCDVEFQDELQEYIDDIASRSPIDFTLDGEGVQDIDDLQAVNMGFHISDHEVQCTITNNEESSITLNAFGGISGDFIIEAFESVNIPSGTSFTFAATFDFTSANAGTRVTKEVVFYDENDRPFTFTLWATSNRQPLKMYDSDDNELTEYDLGNWDDNREHTLVIKNEGLEDVQINSITHPNGDINIVSGTNFSLSINETKEIKLTYNFDSSNVNDSDLDIDTDALDSTFLFSLYAGKHVLGTLYDDVGTELIGDIDFGSYATNDPVVKDFVLTNNSPFDMDLVVTSEFTSFITDLGSLELARGESQTFQVSYIPSVAGEVIENIKISDELSNRKSTISFKGTYSP
ncbi:MAG: hypothetical protein OCD02_20055 [Spirochaetaceae bacterium]